MNHERESTYLLVFKFECVECGCLGVCDAKPGKGFSPSPYQLCPSRFTLLCGNLLKKHLALLKILAKYSYYIYGQPPTLLT